MEWENVYSDSVIFDKVKGTATKIWSEKGTYTHSTVLVWVLNNGQESQQECSQTNCLDRVIEPTVLY